MSRVKLAELERGDRYFAVYTKTGRCVYRTLSEAEARTMCDTHRRGMLEYRDHVKR